MPTTSRGFRYPASSAAPNVPQDLQNAVSDINADLVLGQWANDVSNTTYATPITNTTFATLTGMGPFSVTVPAGHMLEVQFSTPIVSIPATTGVQFRINIGGTFDGPGVYLSNSNAASMGLPVFCFAHKAGTGASVSFSVEVVKNGTGSPQIDTTLIAGGRTLLRHRII